jgi:hypothetical protein
MTAKEERILELKLRATDYERFIWFEEREIEKTEKKIKEAELRLERLKLQKAQMENSLKEYEILFKANRTRLEVYSE